MAFRSGLVACRSSTLRWSPRPTAELAPGSTPLRPPTGSESRRLDGRSKLGLRGSRRSGSGAFCSVLRPRPVTATCPREAVRARSVSVLRRAVRTVCRRCGAIRRPRGARQVRDLLPPTPGPESPLAPSPPSRARRASEGVSRRVPSRAQPGRPVRVHDEHAAITSEEHRHDARHRVWTLETRPEEQCLSVAAESGGKLGTAFNLVRIVEVGDRELEEAAPAVRSRSSSVKSIPRS